MLSIITYDHKWKSEFETDDIIFIVHGKYELQNMHIKLVLKRRTVVNTKHNWEWFFTQLGKRPKYWIP